MKKTVLGVIILLFIGVSTVALQVYVHFAVADMSALSKSAAASVLKGDTQRSIEQTEKLIDLFSSYENVLSAVISHDDLDGIDIALRQIPVYIRTGNTADAAALLSAIKKQLEMIESGESICLGNIL